MKTRKLLAKHGLTKNTRGSYGTYFPNWEKFCDWHGVDILGINENQALNFLAYCYNFTGLNSDLASKALTATISFHKDNGISFIRKAYPSIKRHVDGYRDLRPPDSRPKLPFSEYHTQKTFIYCVNKPNYVDIMRSAALHMFYY